MNEPKSITSKISEMAQQVHLPFPAKGHGYHNVGKNERLVSGMGGAMLATMGLRKADTAGLAMTVAGSILLFRAITGYCPANEAMGRDSTK